ncbi:MAG: tRNA (cytidine(34)-2'-O)-methyltransferase [Pseudomonadota bacterium]
MDTKANVRLALYEPDIALNTGAMIRTAACFGAHVDVIEPCGFPFSLGALKRSGMDYIDETDVTRHDDYDAFLETLNGRLILLTTKARDPIYDWHAKPGDCLLMGRESAGVPEKVHKTADVRLTIPMRPSVRSLNVSVAAGIALSHVYHISNSDRGLR